MKQCLHVLVVEDEETNAEVAAGILSALGHEVVVARNGQEALTVCASRKPAFDLALVDLLMPVMDGYETIRRLRAQEATRELPIICVSALTEGADEAPAEWDAYMTKPYRARQLQGAMASVLQGRGRPGASE